MALNQTARGDEMSSFLMGFQNQQIDNLVGSNLFFGIVDVDFMKDEIKMVSF